jgi:hypothetical protein
VSERDEEIVREREESSKESERENKRRNTKQRLL